eukprot:CAMPEP_0114246780 /NCGR_PEP_ID=MMETSP0058-20121206/12661_1 /TAXON_ID=36894 /ORGANISM="Pyramimonas parkeae, CCMP726" /LENGTH=324 /DNA_ID=CAMNT_0001360021 /DNA_START=571 /DNA_END=1545 /DNA_ORIENTATION=+
MTSGQRGVHGSIPQLSSRGVINKTRKSNRRATNAKLNAQQPTKPSANKSKPKRFKRKSNGRKKCPDALAGGPASRSGAPPHEPSSLLRSRSWGFLNTPGVSSPTLDVNQAHLTVMRTPFGVGENTPASVKALAAACSRGLGVEGGGLIDAFGSMQGRIVPTAWTHPLSHLTQDESIVGAVGTALGTRGQPAAARSAAEGPEAAHHSSPRGSISEVTSSGEDAELEGRDVDLAISTRGLQLLQEGHLGNADANGSEPFDLRVRLNEQAAYICTLEEDNVSLRESLDTMRKELENLRRRSSPTGVAEIVEETAEDDAEHSTFGSQL